MNNKIILLVEDNPSDVELTKRALTQNNIVNKMVVAEDGVPFRHRQICRQGYK
jgi:two-component system response regulator